MTRKLILCQRVVTLVLGFVVATILSPLPLHAQQFFGSVVGTVTDASGGVIPGATITITNIGTNEKRSAKADSAGNYQFVSLVPAVYRIDVEMPNFKRFVRESVSVAVNTTTRADAALQVGEI